MYIGIELKNITDVINNRDFEELNRKFNAFNPLKVLKVDSFEIRHSNVISWLLDTNGNHGLGSMFFEKLIGKLYMKSENDQLLSLKYGYLVLHKSFMQFQIGVSSKRRY